MSCWKAIKYILAVVLVAVCAYIAFPLRKAYYHSWEVISFEEDEEFAYGIPLDDDFDMFVLTKYADAVGVITVDSENEFGRNYEQKKMEIFYGR